MLVIKMQDQFKKEQFDYIDVNKYYYCGENIKASKFSKLMKYVLMGNIKYVRDYLSSVYNISEVINQCNSIGWTALMIAVFNVATYSNLEIVKYLINNKADVNHKSLTQDTPLIVSSIKRSCNYDVMKLLIMSSANVNDVDNNNDNPLNLIAKSIKSSPVYNSKCIRLLLEHKCNPFIYNKNNTYAAQILLYSDDLHDFFNDIYENSVKYFAKENVMEIFLVCKLLRLDLTHRLLDSIVKYIYPTYVDNITLAYISDLYRNYDDSSILRKLLKNNVLNREILQNECYSRPILNIKLIEPLIEYDYEIKYTDYHIIQKYYDLLYVLNSGEHIKQKILKNLEKLNIFYYDTNINKVFFVSFNIYNREKIDIFIESVLNALDKIDHSFKFKYISYYCDEEMRYVKSRQKKIRDIQKIFKFVPKCNILNNDDIIFMLLLITKYISPYKNNNDDIIKRLIIPLLYLNY